jgi:hypothetical protein
MSKLATAPQTAGQTDSISAVRAFLHTAAHDREAAVDRLNQIVDDLDELKHRLSRLHKLSTRYAHVTFSSDVNSLVKMVGQQTLVDTL